jgi:hypothetical protein
VKQDDHRGPARRPGRHVHPGAVDPVIPRGRGGAGGRGGGVPAGGGAALAAAEYGECRERGGDASPCTPS